jgi:hypothetical protein
MFLEPGAHRGGLLCYSVNHLPSPSRNALNNNLDIPSGSDS